MKSTSANQKPQIQFNFNSFFSQQIQNGQLAQRQQKTDSNSFNQKCYNEIRNAMRLRTQIFDEIQNLDQQRKKLFATISIFTKKSQEQFRDEIRGEAPERKKRNRRNADQIQRKFICHQCHKQYGTEGSLAQHIKLKHSDSSQQKQKNSESKKEHKY